MVETTGPESKNPRLSRKSPVSRKDKSEELSREETDKSGKTGKRVH